MTPCRAAIAALAVLVACSHDTERANPLDPELTPPVDLAIAVDDTAGLARLTWSAYSGKAAFDRYLVLRQVFDRQSVNTLASLPDVATMAWIDTTLDPDKVYVYRVSVVNTEGAEVTSIEQSVSPLSLPTADILSHEFDSGSASASLISPRRP